MTTPEKLVRKNAYIDVFKKFSDFEDGNFKDEIVLAFEEFFEWADSASIGYNLCDDSNENTDYVEIFRETLKFFARH